MPERRDSSFDLEELTRLAKRFVEAELFDEAIQLFEVALRLDPSDMGVQLSLAQVKRLRRQPGSERPRSLGDSLREKIRRDSIDAKHFLGLAHLYRDRGDEERAREYLEIAAAKDLPNPAPHKLQGKLSIKRHDFDRARVQLLQSRRFNPFDRETARLLARCCYEVGDYKGALAGYIDAFLLLPDTRREEAGILRDWIQELRDILEWDADRLTHLFHERQEQLRILFDRLEFHRERFEEQKSRPALDDAKTPSRRRGDGRLELATRLRQLDPWSHLTDSQIFLLARLAQEESYTEGELLFAAGTSGSDIFVVEEGEIRVQRETSYGAFPLGIVRAGEIFGEVNFVTRGERSADAVAVADVRVLRLEGRDLEALVAGHPDLGVQLYWSFWHGLAFKLRCTNEQLRTFFHEEGGAEDLLRLRRAESDEAERASVDQATKIALFREKGLTNKDLTSLASFSRERTYPRGAYIFQEGDEGREMFVVLEGRVRISKIIPGAGEEALAILERGDFFGEMALVDGQPRSADARAHDGPVTVVALEERTIHEVLSADPSASLEFLTLLCSLVANRLREIDEKVIGWRIMAGQAAEG